MVPSPVRREREGSVGLRSGKSVGGLRKGELHLKAENALRFKKIN